MPLNLYEITSLIYIKIIRKIFKTQIDIVVIRDNYGEIFETEVKAELSETRKITAVTHNATIIFSYFLHLSYCSHGNFSKEVYLLMCLIVLSRPH